MPIAVQLHPLAKRTIAKRIRQRRAAFSVRLAGLLREYFKQQRARVLTRLSYDAHLHEDTRFSVKALPPAVHSLLPPSEDTALSLAIRPYLEQGILSSADLANLLVGGVLPESSQSAGVQRLLDNAGQRITQINDATRRAVQEQLQTANAAGYNLYQIANGVPADGFRGIADTVEQLYRGRAEAIARTEIGSASLAASQAQWRELGVRYQEIIDGEDDEECAARNGTVVSIEEEVELLHPNCFPPGVAVTADGVVAATLRPYDGKLITIRTSLDSGLRCTPNHPILTGRGWVGAGELVEGDDVFSYRPKLASVAPPTHEYMETSVEKIAGSLLMASFHTGGYIGSFPNAPDQFHGDGGSKGDVDIVRAAGPLLRESNSPFDLELDNQSIFSFTAVELETLAGLCSQQLSLERVDLPTAGRVSSVGGARAGGPATYAESRTEIGVIPTDIRADMCERLAAFIAIVQHGYVVAVEESSYSGHVYNLQTRTGYMIADGLLTSNCTVVTLPTMSDEGAALAAGVGGASGEEAPVEKEIFARFEVSQKVEEVYREVAQLFPQEVLNNIGYVEKAGPQYGDVLGAFRRSERTLVLKPGMSGNKLRNTIAHEITHASQFTDSFRELRGELYRHYVDMVTEVGYKPRGNVTGDFWSVAKRERTKLGIGNRPVTDYAMMNADEYVSETIANHITNAAELLRQDPVGAEIVARLFSR